MPYVSAIILLKNTEHKNVGATLNGQSRSSTTLPLYDFLLVLYIVTVLQCTVYTFAMYMSRVVMAHRIYADHTQLYFVVPRNWAVSQYAIMGAVSLEQRRRAKDFNIKDQGQYRQCCCTRRALRHTPPLLTVYVIKIRQSQGNNFTFRTTRTIVSIIHPKLN